MKTENLLLGTITFGQQTDLMQVKEMLAIALGAGVREIDSAYVYNEGTCEKILGEALKGIPRESYRVATKVNPRITGKLDRDAIFMQQNESLSRLGIDYSDVMYLHFPDPFTPLSRTLEACWELYQAGSFRELGLSNFHARQIEKIMTICEEKGWMKPAVYEGVYNAVSRNAEGELFDTLHRYGMRFTAYNPLAGGMLTGKYLSYEDMPTEGRFAERASYKERYWKEDFFKGVNVIREACEAEDVVMADAALRWLEYHSELKAENGDGIIIGSSRPSQLEKNLTSVEHGPLPESVVKAFDEAWELCKESAPPYARLVGKITGKN